MSTPSGGSGNPEPSDVLPGPQQPSHMSLPELGLALSLYKPGTVRAAAVEEELRRRLVLEKDREPRTPPIVAFLMGALVVVTAMQVGAVLRKAPDQEPRAAGASVHMSAQVTRRE